MKCLIIGLGTFGSTLATDLTNKGHEVMGVDHVEQRVEDIKDNIAVAYIMDATERVALKQLPLSEMDCAIVCIGQSMDNSLRTVAALKELGVEKVYARAIDATHQSILQAMQIKEIFIPEEYAARIFAQKLVENE
ncbi:MAG: TrkA family potassium uptake protein [Paludibacteraceae bacterium]|nr:TrkA family potassium uptake protein [Paludibacteraceae bacterium]